MKVTEVLKEIKPFILGWISESGGGTGPYAPSPHDLDSAHHSGSLADTQAPQFLKTDGSRQLTGNQTVAAGVTFDGVDVSVLGSDFSTHQTATAAAGHAGGIGTHTHQTTAEGGKLDHGAALSGLSDDDHTQYLNTTRHDTTTRHALGTVVPHDDHGALSGLSDDDHTQYLNTTRHDTTTRHTLGTVVPHDDHGALSGLSDDDHPQYAQIAATETISATWTFSTGPNFSGGIQSNFIPAATDTYDLGSSTKLWRKGYLSELDAVVFAENTVTLLGGWFIISKDQGALAADMSSGATTIDFGKAMTVGNFVLFRAAGAVEYVQVGSLVSGTTYNVTRNLDGSGANAWVAGTPFCVLGASGDGRIELNAYDTPRISVIAQLATYNAQTEYIRLGDLNGGWGYSAAAYGLAIGEYGANKANLTIDPTNGLRIRTYSTTVLQFDNSGGASITGVLALGSSGGIYQGTGSFASPTTGLKIWNDSGVGRIAGYSSGTVQWYAATDGKLYAGGGTALIDSTGFKASLNSSSSTDDGRYQFIDASGNVCGYITGYKDSTDVGIGVRVPAQSGYDSNAYILAIAYTNKNAEATLAARYTTLPDVYLKAVAGTGGVAYCMAYPGFRVNSGLTVGSVSVEADSGDVLYTGDLTARRSSTNYTGYIYVPITPVTIWSGTAKSAATYTMNSSVWTHPATIKAVAIEISAAWSSAGAGYNAYARIAGGSDLGQVVCRSAVAGAYDDKAGIVNCDSSGNFEVVVSSATTGTYLRIYGYFI